MPFLRKHSLQILIHILFWVLFIVVSLFIFSPYYWKENPFLQYLSILVIIVYINNIWLLPLFIKKRWYILYIFLFSVISFLATQLYCNVFAQCGCSILKCLSDYLWQTLVPLIFFSFIWMLFRFIDKQEEVKTMQQQHTEMELKLLKSQINPHVLLNNLNTIYSYSIEKPEKVSQLILMLSDNLKYILYESTTKTVSLEKELQFLDNYIEFQKIRTEGIKIIEYTKTIDNFQLEIAPLLLITILENAFKHSTINSHIYFHVEIKNAILTCICKNNYKEESSPKQSNLKIGLTNLEKRLHLLYPDHHELKINKGEMFNVHLKIQL